MSKLVNQEAEQNLLGSFLIGGIEAFDRIADIGLVASDFYHQQHQFIFSAIVQMVAKNKPIDVTTVNAEIIGSKGQDFNQLNYLIDLDRNTPSAANNKSYAEIVRQCSIARKAIDSARELIENLENSGGANAVQLIGATATALDNTIGSEVGNSYRFTRTEIMSIALDDFTKRHDNDGKITGTATGLHALDDVLNGMEAGELVIIAGRPGMGKTTFATTVANNVAGNDKEGVVAVFSLEMMAAQIAMRELSSAASVSMTHIKRGDDDGGQNFTRMTPVMCGTVDNIIYDTSPDISIAQIRSGARQIKRDHGLKMIVVDYLQLMSDTSKKHQNKNEELGYITRQAKAIAQELEVPFLMLSQLSRKTEERADKRPVMSDLKDSGSIEQDADVILLMYREEYYFKDTMNRGIGTAIVAKSRQGESGVDVHLKFEGQYSRFSNLDEGFIYDYGSNSNKPRRKGFALL